MQLGVHLPQNEIGHDRDQVRSFVQTSERIGYDYLIMGEHVLATDAAEQDEDRPYTPDWVWHEPITLFAWLAGQTERLRFMPSVLVLPQRQAVLVAKQVAEVDVLSGGRMMLAVGTGWSTVEYEALGVEFRRRGRIVEEQIQLLRRLWTERLVTYEGQFHRVSGGGLNPQPSQPIPIWYGGMANVVLDRIGRLCDGWSVRRTDLLGLLDAERRAEFERMLGRVHAAAEGAGRDPAAIKIGVAIDVKDRTTDDLVSEAGWWRERGATHLAVRTTHAGFTEFDQHIEAVQRFHEAFSS